MLLPGQLGRCQSSWQGMPTRHAKKLSSFFLCQQYGQQRDCCTILPLITRCPAFCCARTTQTSGALQIPLLQGHELFRERGSNRPICSVTHLQAWIWCAQRRQPGTGPAGPLPNGGRTSQAGQPCGARQWQNGSGRQDVVAPLQQLGAPASDWPGIFWTVSLLLARVSEKGCAARAQCCA